MEKYLFTAIDEGRAVLEAKNYQKANLIAKNNEKVVIKSIGPKASEYPNYKGSYEAKALFADQVFRTGMKVMQEDFTVRAINYTEAPNDSGITVTIGG